MYVYRRDGLYWNEFRIGGIVEGMGRKMPYALAFGFHSTKVGNILYKGEYKFQLRALRLQC